MRVAINGFGRIGRALYKLASNVPEIEIVAINDLASKEALAYLLQYDSVYGQFTSSLDDVQFFQEKDPTQLPWGELGIDVVVESTGFFRDKEKAQAHITAGAKRVVISAPSKDAPTVLMNVNQAVLAEERVTCNASCTTNAGSPIIGILDAAIGIEKALLNTVHGYTATQRTVDGPDAKDPRKGRAAAVNIIPTSTGAAIATTKAHTQLQDKFDGIALRVPVPAGSIADITFIAKRDTTVEEVNEVLTAAAKHPSWSSIFAVTSDPVVSTDIVGRTEASIADLAMTRVVGGTLVKVLAWYDNEMGYAHTLLQHVVQTGKHV